MKMNRQNLYNDMKIVAVPFDGVTVYFVTASVTEKNMGEVFGRAAQAMDERNAGIVSQFLFGGRQFYPQALSAIGQLDWPLTQLHGDACSGTDVTAAQWIAVSGAELHPVLDGERRVGSWFETENARYCLLGDLRADDLTCSRETQAGAVFEKMERLLADAEMDFTDTARTWLYLNELLEWYDEFNVVRTRFFRERGVFDKMVPASTGIGAGSAAGEAMVAALLAVKLKNDRVSVFPVPSPLQCPALDYASSFARAVEVAVSGSRLLTISGTASIEPGGKTVYLEDTAGQIKLSMQVVEAILKSRGMGWEHVVRAIAYFKDIREVSLLNDYCAQYQLPPLPVAISHADVCRHDLLFEIELDAAIVD
jgi:enamine deaminase RidA (YjgF/YER057c/UK114 family)